MNACVKQHCHCCKWHTNAAPAYMARFTACDSANVSWATWAALYQTCKRCIAQSNPQCRSRLGPLRLAEEQIKGAGVPALTRFGKVGVIYQPAGFLHHTIQSQRDLGPITPCGLSSLAASDAGLAFEVSALLNRATMLYNAQPVIVPFS